MENANTTGKNTANGKKEMKKELADKIAAAIPELKILLGEKKFEHRIKKAVKLITEGLHKQEAKKVVKKVKAKAKAAVAKKAAAKKAGKPASV